MKGQSEDHESTRWIIFFLSRLHTAEKDWVANKFFFTEFVQCFAVASESDSEIPLELKFWNLSGLVCGKLQRISFV